MSSFSSIKSMLSVSRCASSELMSGDARRFFGVGKKAASEQDW